MARRVVPAREFRIDWTRLSEETVVVTSNRREIGYWVPIGTDEWKLIEQKDNDSWTRSGESGTGSSAEPGSDPAI